MLIPQKELINNRSNIYYIIHCRSNIYNNNNSHYTDKILDICTVFLRIFNHCGRLTILVDEM